MRQLSIHPTFSAWQKAARLALTEGWSPDLLIWQELSSDAPSLPLFEEAEESHGSQPSAYKVPKVFLQMADRVACHRDERRWALLYRVLWRLTHGEPKLLEVVVDDDVHELARMDKAVRHDVHKMRAFVRFRSVAFDGEPWYVAWFEPEHHIVEKNSRFFRDRFAGMRWSILTPDRCLHWDSQAMTVTAGVPKSEAPETDQVEDLWRTYYGHIFNPARVKVKAMQSEMPKRYWKNLPEAAIIPALLNDAPRRVSQMLSDSREQVADEQADGFLAVPPHTQDIEVLRDAACTCKACPLWKKATQTVFGEGPANARIMVIGEQPGDQEDLAGRPFIGPAGLLLDKALIKAGLVRSELYVTNTVKHFKWEPSGKRRLHKKPSARDIIACKPWLEAEIRSVQPALLICLGATASQAVIGPHVQVIADRGQIMESAFGIPALITYHPSALLRAPTEAQREAQFAEMVTDLQWARTHEEAAASQPVAKK